MCGMIDRPTSHVNRSSVFGLFCACGLLTGCSNTHCSSDADQESFHVWFHRLPPAFEHMFCALPPGWICRGPCNRDLAYPCERCQRHPQNSVSLSFPCDPPFGEGVVVCGSCGTKSSAHPRWSASNIQMPLISGSTKTECMGFVCRSVFFNKDDSATVPKTIHQAAFPAATSLWHFHCMSALMTICIWSIPGNEPSSSNEFRHNRVASTVRQCPSTSCLLDLPEFVSDVLGALIRSDWRVFSRGNSEVNHVNYCTTRAPHVSFLFACVSCTKSECLHARVLLVNQTMFFFF